MKKRLFSIALVLVMMFSLTVPALAADDPGSREALEAIVRNEVNNSSLLDATKGIDELIKAAKETVAEGVAGIVTGMVTNDFIRSTAADLVSGAIKTALLGYGIALPESIDINAFIDDILNSEIVDEVLSSDIVQEIISRTIEYSVAAILDEIQLPTTAEIIDAQKDALIQKYTDEIFYGRTIKVGNYTANYYHTYKVTIIPPSFTITGWNTNLIKADVLVNLAIDLLSGGKDSVSIPDFENMDYTDIILKSAKRAATEVITEYVEALIVKIETYVEQKIEEIKNYIKDEIAALKTKVADEVNDFFGQYKIYPGLTNVDTLETAKQKIETACYDAAKKGVYVNKDEILKKLNCMLNVPILRCIPEYTGYIQCIIDIINCLSDSYVDDQEGTLTVTINDEAIANGDTYITTKALKVADIIASVPDSVISVKDYTKATLAINNIYNVTVTSPLGQTLSFTVIIDGTNPTIKISATTEDDAEYKSKWTNKTVTVNLEITKTIVSDLKSLQYQVKGEDGWPVDEWIDVVNNTLVFENDIEATIRFKAVSNAGNEYTTTGFNVKVDKTAPTITWGETDATNKSIKFEADEPVYFSFLLNDELKEKPLQRSMTLSPTTSAIYSDVIATDRAGNVTVIWEGDITIDKVKPVVEYTAMSGGDVIKSGTWTNQAVTFTLSNKKDDKVIGDVVFQYQLRATDDAWGEEWTVIDGNTITFEDDFVGRIRFRAVSGLNEGNATVGFVMKLDTTAPVITVDGSYEEGLAFYSNVKVTSNEPVVITFLLDDEEGTKSQKKEFSFSVPGDYTNIIATDQAGNTTTIESFTIDKTKPKLNLKAEYTFGDVTKSYTNGKWVVANNIAINIEKQDGYTYEYRQIGAKNWSKLGAKATSISDKVPANAGYVAKDYEIKVTNDTNGLSTTKEFSIRGALANVQPEMDVYVANNVYDWGTWATSATVNVKITNISAQTYGANDKVFYKTADSDEWIELEVNNNGIATLSLTCKADEENVNDYSFKIVSPFGKQTNLASQEVTYGVYLDRIKGAAELETVGDVTDTVTLGVSFTKIPPSGIQYYEVKIGSAAWAVWTEDQFTVERTKSNFNVQIRVTSNTGITGNAFSIQIPKL